MKGTTYRNSVCLFFKTVLLISLYSINMQLIAQEDGFVCPEGVESEVCEALEKNICLRNVENSIELCRSKLKELKEERPWWFKPREIIASSFEGHDYNQITSFITWAIGALLATIIAYFRVKINALVSRLGDPLIKKRKVKYSTKGVNLLLIGEGGSGKTSIIRALSGSYDAAPDRSTAFPRTYSIVHEVDIIDQNGSIKRSLERIYANDYRGQDSSQLMETKELVKREKRITSTIMVIVVDLFALAPAGGDSLEPQRQPDKKRIDSQIAAYPPNMLDIIFSLSDNLSGVVLFINKVDLIKQMPPRNVIDAKQAYEDLSTKLHERGKHFTFEVIVGAASKGLGITGFDPTEKQSTTLYEFIKSKMVDIN